MANVSYQYKWDGDDLIIRYKKSGRTIQAQLGNAIFTISRRTAPKRYVKIVTGKAAARKGIIPNSLATLDGRWGFLASSLAMAPFSFIDDFGTQNKLVIPKLNSSKSFHKADGNIVFDGGCVVSENAVEKLFW